MGVGIPNVLNTGRSGLVAAKAGIATTGHNVANANTEGYSRQRVEQKSSTPQAAGGSPAIVGSGVGLSANKRINDEYIEKQLRSTNRDYVGFEEKDMVLRQAEDIFNEMGGEGMNRLMARFFNEFRKLSNEPENEAIRQSVRESTQAVVNDFHRVHKELEDIRSHIDARIEGYAEEMNAHALELKDMNLRIRQTELVGGNASDLHDQRDLLLKKMAGYMDLQVHKEKEGSVSVDIRGVGPLVIGPTVERFYVERTKADGEGKAENAFDLKTTASASATITHAVRGGRIGALLEARDKVTSSITNRLDDMAYTLVNAVNDIHRQGFTRDGVQGVDFFAALPGKERAAEFIQLSSAVRDNINNIASAAQPDAPGDNRIAIAISGIQGERIMSNGKSTFDDFYNSIMSDVGVITARNRSSMNQTKDIITQLGKMREQISGVSIDEETTNLMQYQHAFDASAKVIQVADEMLKTVLELRR